MESYGNVLLETFARKNVSFRVTQPRTLRFSLHYSGCILLVNQYDLTYILLHNWSVAGGWKSEKLILFMHYLWLTESSKNSLICRGELQLYSWYYYLFKFRFKWTPVFVQTADFCLNQMIWLIGTEDEKQCVLNKTCLSSLTVRKRKYWL